MTYRKSMSDAIREVQESTIKPYVSMSMGGQYNVLDKDSKVVYSTRDKILAYDYFKKNFDKLKEELQETPQGFALVSKAKEIAKKFANNMSKAVAEIEKLEKGLSNNSSVKDALQKANESLEIDEEVSLQEVSDNLKLAVLKRKIKQYKDKVLKKTMSTIKSPLFAGYEEVEEGRMKDIFTAGEQGKSAEEIAKIMKLPLKTVKNILGEEVFEEQILEFTSDMITRLQKSYSTMPKRISPEQATALSKHLDRLDLASLKQLTKAKIPFVTALARNKVYKKTGKFEAVEEPKKDMPDDKERVAKESSDKEIASLKDQINILKTKLENEKHKAVKPVPNPKTGEVPLTIGVAYKHFKAAEDKEKKEEVSEAITVKKYKNAVDPTKDGLQISKTSGMGGSIFIKDKKELKDLLDKIDKNKGNLKEDAKSDKEKRLQKAKDMIKYYDAQKKAALNGKNKDLAKKMLKNDSDRIKDDPCWTGYKMVGMKKGKGGKEVPNCVPEGAVKLVDKLLSKKLKEKQK
jgi:plasmid maintenance system antidote protein VapI